MKQHCKEHCCTALKGQAQKAWAKSIDYRGCSCIKKPFLAGTHPYLPSSSGSAWIWMDGAQHKDATANVLLRFPSESQLVAGLKLSLSIVPVGWVVRGGKPHGDVALHVVFPWSGLASRAAHWITGTLGWTLSEPLSVLKAAKCSATEFRLLKPKWSLQNQHRRFWEPDRKSLLQMPKLAILWAHTTTRSPVH